MSDLPSSSALLGTPKPSKSKDGKDGALVLGLLTIGQGTWHKMCQVTIRAELELA
eukprot:CAMPEP_0169103264 /NCGR_PEP_ID=MMETSP1015-20121227/22620_1 /TAXON_ID=342587 /ORGANISM="Karlodinium micrum, Strain CCMP2283" /LENGTH=54 /DNA_ID=CAMNT_0009164445 /DNA_START=674 /DNA_END=834 /DNA_ORIENTATION=-